MGPVQEPLIRPQIVGNSDRVQRSRTGQRERRLRQVVAIRGVGEPMNQVDQAHVDACLTQHEVRVAESLVDPFRLEQRRVREHLGEAVGIDQMPAVFWRRGALTVDDNRCGTVALGGKNFFETERQLPVVAVIVEGSAGHRRAH